MLAVLLAAMDQTVVGTALPRIADDLGRLDLYSWVFTAYLLAVAVVVPIAGQLGDRLGRRALLLAGLAVFVAGSLLAGLAGSMPALVGFRALQGLGAGALTANAYAVLGDLYPPSQLGRYNGIVSGVYGLASVVGPVVGGLITDGVGWRWTFLINVPLCALAVVPLAAYVPRRAGGRRDAATDYAGIVLLALTLVPGLLALTRLGAGRSFGEVGVLGPAALSVVALVALLAVEARAAAPILPLRLLRGLVGLSAAITFLASVALFACSIYLPLHLQLVHGLGPTSAGLLMTPMVLSLVAGSIVGGIRVTRSGRYRPITLFGLAGLGLGLGLLVAGGVEVPARTAAALALVGLGFGLALPALTVAAQNAAGHDELGVATALGKFARSVGGIVSVAACGALLEHQVGQSLGDGALRLHGPQTLGAAELAQLRAGISGGITTIVQAAGVVAALALAGALALRELPLRRTIESDRGPP